MQCSVCHVPEMPLQLVSNVSGTQHGAVIYEVLVTPFSGAAGLFPASPDIQKDDQVAFSNSKPAQHAQRWIHNPRFTMALGCIAVTAMTEHITITKHSQPGTFDPRTSYCMPQGFVVNKHALISFPATESWR